MVDASWDGVEEPARGWRVPAWVRWILVAALLPLGLMLLLGTGALANRRKAWPLVRAVAQRLQTDEGGRELFRANPAMGSLYGTEEAFLDLVRPARPALAALPPSEPQQERATYRVMSNPGGVDCSVALPGGTWLEVVLESRSPFAQGGSEAVRVLLAPTPEGLRALARRPAEAALAARWAEFRAVAEGLGTDEGTRRLLEANPGLRAGFPDAEALLAQARRWRTLQISLPAARQDARGRASISRRQVFSRLTETVSYRTDAGAGLSLTWREGRLVSLVVWSGRG
jgi:hypothetical protein